MNGAMGGVHRACPPAMISGMSFVQDVHLSSGEFPRGQACSGPWIGEFILEAETHHIECMQVAA